MNAKLLTRNLRSRIEWARYNSRLGIKWGGAKSRHNAVMLTSKMGYVAIHDLNTYFITGSPYRLYYLED